jgi:MoxR-like ATPase
LARARALLDGRDFALPDDVRAAAPDVLRHRVAFNYRLLTDRVDPETIIAGFIASVPTP